MSGFSDLSFLWPHLLWVLLALPVLIFVFFAGEQRRQLLLNQLIAIRLQPRLAGTASKGKRRLAFGLTLLGLALAVVALAGPRWGSRFEERVERGRDIILAIDASKSMLAQDLKPNRLARAKLAAQDLLKQLEGDRVGLIAFAGTAFLQAPLTADYGAIRDALAEIDTEIIPRGGTNLSAAMEAASDAFGKGESEQRALIIFTDGEQLEEEATSGALARAGKCRIFTVGLGSAEGALLPIAKKGGGTEFVRDENGQYVTSRLDEKRLREVAEGGGGFYVHLENGPAEMQKIVREGLSKMKETTTASRFEKQPIERYQWPLAGSVLCFLASLLLGERRRMLRPVAAAALAWVGLAPDAAVAGIFDKIGGAQSPPAQTPATPAAADGEKKEPVAPAAPATSAATKPTAVPEAAYNQGCAAFQAGDFSSAAQEFSSALGNGSPTLQAKAAYNLANTLARRGAKLEKKEDKIQEWKNAIQHYDRALTVQPGNADAKFNRELVQRAIAALEKKDEQQDDKKEEKKDDEKKEQEKQEKKDQQKQEQEKNGDSKQDQNGEKKDEQKEGKDGEQKQPQQGEKGDPKDGGKEGKQAKEDPNGKEQAGKQDPDKKGENQPKSEQGKPEDKKTGDVKAAKPEAAEKPEDPAAAEAKEEAAAAAAGQMTKKEAKQLLESIREGRVRLLDPREAARQLPPGKFKDW